METEARDLQAEVAQIFTSAGWTAGESFEWSNKFAAPNLLAVGGIDPWGTPRTRAVRADVVSDAHWLVAHAKEQAPALLETEATLDPIALAQEQEPEQSLEDESNGETGEDAEVERAPEALSEGIQHAGDDSSGGGHTGDFRDTSDWRADADELASVEGEEPIDADFEAIDQLGSEDDLLADEDFDPPALEGGDFEGTAPEPIPTEGPQDRFIGLDDLDRVRSLRIGDVATEALRLTTLIEQAVAEQDGEFSNIQAYVVSNLDKHTGAFTPQDDASRQTYGRFLELSSARSKIALIDTRRKDATAFLIAAGRDDVVSFDVKAAFA